MPDAGIGDPEPSLSFARRGYQRNKADGSPRRRSVNFRASWDVGYDIVKSNKYLILYPLGGGLPLAVAGGIAATGEFKCRFLDFVPLRSAFGRVDGAYSTPTPSGYWRVDLAWGYNISTSATLPIGTDTMIGSAVLDLPLEEYYADISGTPGSDWVAALASLSWSLHTDVRFSPSAQLGVGTWEVFDPYQRDTSSGWDSPRHVDFAELPVSWSGSLSFTPVQGGTSGSTVTTDLSAGVQNYYWGASVSGLRGFKPLYLALWGLTAQNYKTGTYTGDLPLKCQGRWGDASGLDAAMPAAYIAQPIPGARYSDTGALDVGDPDNPVSGVLRPGAKLEIDFQATPLQKVEVQAAARRILDGASLGVALGGSAIAEAVIAPDEYTLDKSATPLSASGVSVLSQTLTGTDPTYNFEAGGTSAVYIYQYTVSGAIVSSGSLSTSVGPSPGKVLQHVSVRSDWEGYNAATGMWKARLFEPFDALSLSQASSTIDVRDGGGASAYPITLTRNTSGIFNVATSPDGFTYKRLCHKRLKVRLRSLVTPSVTLRLTLQAGSGGGSVPPGELAGVMVSPRSTTLDYEVKTGDVGVWVDRIIDITLPATSVASAGVWDRNTFTSLRLQSIGPSTGSWRIEVQSIETVTGASRANCLDPTPGLPATGTIGEHGTPPAWALGPLVVSQGGWPSLFTARDGNLAASRTVTALASEINRVTLSGTAPSAMGNSIGGRFAAIRDHVFSMLNSGWSATLATAPRGAKLYGSKSITSTSQSTTGTWPYHPALGLYTVGTFVQDGTSWPWPASDATDADTLSETLGGDGMLITWASAGVSTLGTESIAWPVDLALSSPLKAQWVGQSIRCYPGAGEVGARATKPGNYGPTTKLLFWAVGQGGVAGQLVSDSDDGEVPVTETREYSGGSLVTMGSPAGRGHFAAIASADGYASGDEPLRGDFPNAPAGVLWTVGKENDVKLLPGSELSLMPSAGWIAHPRHRERRWIRLWLNSLHGLSLLHSSTGCLCLASVGNVGQIRFRRDHYAAPVAWILDADVTSGPLDSQPALFLYPSGRIGLLFTRSGATRDVWECYSDDDGATWSEPAMSFSNASYPGADIDFAGGVLRAAICESGAGYVLKATYQAPGDVAASSPFALQRWTGSAMVDMRVERRGFSLKSAPEGGGALILACILEGDTSDTILVSRDFGATWSAA